MSEQEESHFHTITAIVQQKRSVVHMVYQRCDNFSEILLFTELHIQL